jgi:hypothetical protein
MRSHHPRIARGSRSRVAMCKRRAAGARVPQAKSHADTRLVLAKLPEPLGLGILDAVGSSPQSSRCWRITRSRCKHAKSIQPSRRYSASQCAGALSRLLQPPCRRCVAQIPASGSGTVQHPFASKSLKLSGSVKGVQSTGCRHTGLASPVESRAWNRIFEPYGRQVCCRNGARRGQLAERDSQARAALAEGLGRWQDSIRSGLQALQGRGKLRGDADPAALATATMALIQGGLLLTQVRRDPQQLRSALDAALALLRAQAT